MADRAPTEPGVAGAHVVVVYDCLFPLTLGGVERWYRTLVGELVAAGASVTYLTRRQWAAEPPQIPGVRVVAVSGAGGLYDARGVRRIAPTVAFGLGTLWWFLRHRRTASAVVVASFPYFSLLGARCGLLGTPRPIFVDVFELWDRAYWRRYAGAAAGRVGYLVQSLCLRVTKRAQVFTARSADRLRALGYRGSLVSLPGLLPDRAAPTVSLEPPADATVLYVGRLVRDKGVGDLVGILQAVRSVVPDATLVVVGDGPARAELEATASAAGLRGSVTFAGRVTDAELDRLFAAASCTVVPSRREGYGIVVAESAAAGTPVVVAQHPENQAADLVAEGVNGFVRDPSAASMANGVLACLSGGTALRESTHSWYQAQRVARSAVSSARVLVALIAREMS